MIYFNYFTEIKTRLFLVVFSWIFTSISCYLYKEMLLVYIIKLSSSETLSQPYFIFTDVTEILYSYVNLIFFFSNQVLIIFLLYHIFMFFIPGLYYLEYKNSISVLLIFLIIWVLSLCFYNVFLMSFSWKFFLSFQNIGNEKTLPLFFEAKVSEYLTFYFTLYYYYFCNCLFFMSCLFFINFFSRNLSNVKSFRRVFYCVFVIFSTLFSPPDVFSQIFLSFFLIMFYEFFVLCIIIKNKLIRKPIKTSQYSYCKHQVTDR